MKEVTGSDDVASDTFISQGEQDMETQANDHEFRSKTKHYEYPEIPVARTSEEYKVLYKRA